MHPSEKHPLVIDAQGLVKRFGNVTAVAGASFQVYQGEFFALLGPNGAGKTSVIRMVYGFSPTTAGDLRVFDLPISSGWRCIRQRIGVCHQENTLDTDLTVEQNLWLFARYFNIPKTEARRRADELLDFFALSHKSAAKVMELSGGMARRLQLARTLINNPELIILDEPTTGLDPQSRHQVWDRLRALSKRGLSMLLTTHYMEEAENLCDRLLIMDHGKVLVQGSPKDLIKEHVGKNVMDVEVPEQGLLEYLKEHGVDHDIAEQRVIIYLREQEELGRTLRRRFSMERCTFRRGALEDVFLRLTGRELRE